jgi:hypothetical protein
VSSTGRQRHSVDRPNEQWRVQLSLQPPDLGSHGRLREMELPSCFRDFTDLGNNQEGVQ